MKKKIKIHFVLGIIISITLSAHSNNEYIGIVEQHFNDWNIDSIQPFVIRVSFYKNETDWKSMPFEFGNKPQSYIAVYPKKLNWSICFDGKILGKINSTIPTTINYYKDIGIHLIDNMNDVPRIGKPSEQFSGWMSTNVYRPIIVSTLPYCTDSTKLKPYKPNQQDVQKVISSANLLRKGSLNSFSNKYQIEKSYASSKVKLVCISFQKANSIPIDTSDVIEAETGNDRFAWFVIKDNECKYLKSNMLLIDAGDYDNNGEVETIFKFEEYDHDGYRLFFDDFKKHSDFSWIYH